MKSVSCQLEHLTRLFQETARPLLEEVGYGTAQTAISTSSRMTRLKDDINSILGIFLNVNEFAEEKVEPDTRYDYDNSTLPTLEPQVARQLAALSLDPGCAIQIYYEKVAA